MNRRMWLGLIVSQVAGLTIGCRQGGNLSLFGYTTEPPFDPNIRSVYIPTFKLAPVVTSPLRSLDVDLTDAVVKELTSRKSPIKVVSDPARADTILIGTIADVRKTVLSLNQQALSMESELILGVDVVWRDQRTGEVLSNPKITKPSPGVAPFDPQAEASPVIPNDAEPVPVRVTVTGRWLAQNGETTVIGADAATRKAARLIVNMMETPWQLR